MFPAAFDYAAPTTLGEALALLEQRGDEAKIMAGGQSLIPLLKLRFAQPALVIDIGRLPAMAGIGRDNGHLSIGALARHVDIERNADLPKLCRFAAWACLVLLAVLSWLPGEAMIRTGINGRIEHPVAYMGTMLVVSAAYGIRLGSFRLAALLIAYAGILEVGQNFSPGRHASPFDFGASSFGVILGAIVFWLTWRWLRDTPIGREMQRAVQP